MKNTFLALAVFVSIISCKKNTVQIKEEEENLPTDIEVKMIAAPAAESVQEGSLKYNFLGYGYDVTDKYNDAASVRGQVIDIDALVLSTPDRFDLGLSTSGYWVDIYGTDAADISRNLSSRIKVVNNVKAFGNTIASSFPDVNAFDKKYIYGYYSLVQELKRLKINLDYSTGENLLSNFGMDVNVLSPEELVRKYGTHVLRHIVLGNKFEVLYQAEAKKEERWQLPRTGLTYAMKKLFALSTGSLDPIDLKILNANASARVYYRAIGADPSKLKVVELAPTAETPYMVNISDWLSSSSRDKAKFISVNEEGLIPLDEFIGDSAKKTQVKEYIAKYIKSHEVKLTD